MPFCLAIPLCTRHVVAARRPASTKHALVQPTRATVIRPAHARCRQLTCRAEKHNESDVDQQQDFQALAKIVAGKLASEFAGQEDAFGKLQSWLGGASDAESSGEEAGIAREEKEEEGVMGKVARNAAQYLTSSSPRGSTGEVEGEGSTVGKLAHLAADYLGSGDKAPAAGSPSPRTDQAGQEGDSSLLAKMAAEYLGVDSLTTGAGYIKRWLTNPSNFEERDDIKVVGALVHRLLQSYEKHTGESFEGREHQYDWLTHYAKRVLGSSMTRSLVKGLVKSYLGIPLR